MCGGPRCDKPLNRIGKERIIERTIRLLRQNGVSDISISSLDDRYLQFMVPVIRHYNPLVWDGFVWLRAFCPMECPVCYLYGDVFYSDEAIRKIVQTQTDDIEMFGSSPPFSTLYLKRWAEPFGFKVQNPKRFRQCIDETLRLDREGKFSRHPISWELWQVIKGTPLNKIDYSNYTAINDYTVDVDDEQTARVLTAYT